jgi:uncharacterized membrane protein YuzA (DUF378 family)
MNTLGKSELTFDKLETKFFKIELNSEHSQVNIEFKNFLRIGNQFSLLRTIYTFSSSNTPQIEDLSIFYQKEHSFTLGNDNALTLTESKVIVVDESESSNQLNRLLATDEDTPQVVYLAMYSDQGTINLDVSYDLTKSLSEDKLASLTRMIYILIGVSIFLLVCLFFACILLKNRKKKFSSRNRIHARKAKGLNLDDSHIEDLNSVGRVQNIHHSNTNIVVKNLNQGMNMVRAAGNSHTCSVEHVNK